MAIGERIRYFRNLRGMTQKYLGMRVGLPGSAPPTYAWRSMRRATRTPKADLVEALAYVLDVSPQAFDRPGH